MIGGSDIVFDPYGMDAGSSLASVARIALRYWPDAVFVDAERGERFSSYTAAEFGSLRELFVFRDELSRSIWEESGAASDNMNTMICAIARDEELTLVVEDSRAAPMNSILNELEGLLNGGSPWQSWRAA